MAQPNPTIGVRGYLEPEIRAACEHDKGLPTATLSDRELAESAFRAALLACRESLALRREIAPLLREQETRAALIELLETQTLAARSRAEFLRRAAASWIPAIAALIAAVAAMLKG